MKKIRFLKISEIKLGAHFSVNIWFFPVAISAILSRYSEFFFTAFAVALCHELAHIFCARLVHIKVTRITVFPFGISARLSTEYIKSSQKEFLIAFAGPLLNLILFWFSVIGQKIFSLAALQFCADINLAMALINLLPILPLDGGRMLKAILTQKAGIIRAYNFMLRLSRILVCALTVFALYIFFYEGFNFSLILISVFLLQNLVYEQRNISHIAMKEVLESSKKLNTEKPVATKIICVCESSRASVLLRYLSYDYFCIIHVIDKKSEISKTLTETQVLTKLTQSGIQVRFGDI